MQSFRLILIFVVFLLGSSFYSVTFNWKPRANEPAFEIDVSRQWNRYINYENKTRIVLFSDPNKAKRAFIEVRTKTLDKDYDFSEMMHRLTARLSTRFSFVQLVYDKLSPYRPQQYIAKWEIKEFGHDFIAKTAFIIRKNQVLTVMCMAKKKYYSRYKILFENAILSLNFSNTGDNKNKSVEKDKKKK